MSSHVLQHIESEGILRGLCHGDDFVVIAQRRRLAEFGELLMERLEVPQTGHIGFASGVGKSLRALKQHQQRARRHGPRTRPVPCQQDGGGTRLDRLQEGEDASTEARPQDTLANREQQDFGAAGSSALRAVAARCLLGSRQWTYRNQ